MYLSVVVPAFNEEKIITETVRRVSAFLSLVPWESELVVVSDGSTDRTNEIVSDLASRQKNLRLISFKQNHGKGASVRRGVQAAHGERILFADADLSTPIKEVDKLLAALDQGADVAIGSRALREPGCDVQQSFKRWLSGRVFNFLVKTLVLKGFSDTQCGFKCFKREPARALFAAQKLDGFTFDVEILCLAAQKGYRIKEVPVMWKEGKQSKVKLLRDSFIMLKDLFYLRKTSCFGPR